MTVGRRPVAIAISSPAWVEHVSVANAIRRAPASCRNTTVYTACNTPSAHLSSNYSIKDVMSLPRFLSVYVCLSVWSVCQKGYSRSSGRISMIFFGRSTAPFDKKQYIRILQVSGIFSLDLTLRNAALVTAAS